RRLPVIRHQPRMRIRREPAPADFHAEAVELVFGQAAFQERTRVDARAGMALIENQIARMVLARRAPEMVETDVVQRGAGGETGDVPAEFARLAVGAHHHRHRVPADQRADAPFHRRVAGRFGLEMRGNGVDVFGGRIERQVPAGTARLVHQLFEQEVRALGAFGADHGVDRFDPFAGFRRIGIVVEQYAGQVVHRCFLVRIVRAHRLSSDHSPRPRSGATAFVCILTFPSFNSRSARICASTHAMAVMLTTRRTVACGVSTCTGLATPIRIGPITTPSHITRVMLKAVLAASRLGNTNTLARPVRREFGNTRSRNAGSSARSACISPSTSSFGTRLRMMRSASCSLRVAALSRLPKFDAESSAMRASMPNSFSRSEACSVALAICSASGSSCTWVSRKKYTPLSLAIA